MLINFLELLLTEKLEEINPSLDILGSDRRVLQIACQDFANYLKFHWKLFGKNASECELVEKLEKFFEEDPNELKEFLKVWVGVWFKKWKERVKLLIGNNSSNKWSRALRIINKTEPLWRRLSRRQELQEVIIFALVKNGEICGTKILSENLLKMELKEKRVQRLRGREQKLLIVNTALRKAKELAHSKGPLIFVKIDKGYYNN